MVKKEYRVVILQAGPDESVILGLAPVVMLHSISDEEYRTPDPQKVLVGPALESEDAKVARQMVSAMMDEAAKKIREFGPPPSTSFAPLGFIPLNLTKEEYEEIGKPTPNEIITLTLTLNRVQAPKSEDDPHV